MRTSSGLNSETLPLVLESVANWKQQRHLTQLPPPCPDLWR